MTETNKDKFSTIKILGLIVLAIIIFPFMQSLRSNLRNSNNENANDIKDVIGKIDKKDFDNLQLTSVALGLSALCIKENNNKEEILSAISDYNSNNIKLQNQTANNLKNNNKITKTDKETLDKYFYRLVIDYKNDNIGYCNNFHLNLKSDQFNLK